jgi:type I restriction enzyme, S subunit
VRRGRVIPEYLALALNSPKCYEQSQLFTRGATNQDLGLNRMKNIVLPLPPSLEEQEEIVRITCERLSRLRQEIGNIEKEIELIREYRTRLLADVVTGKLDVRRVELPEIEELEVRPAAAEEVDGGGEDELVDSEEVDDVAD